MSVRESLGPRRIAVCVGAGGVGKTTVAAALAHARARQGGKALVCTIDPARRLANALGLEALGNVESPVPGHELAAAGIELPGRLHARMLDVKRSWDDLIARHAPDGARREKIFQNRLYQQLSSALAGSQEYMAMEKLYELATERDYDLVVLDTPPTVHALDFLEAPDRILDFLGNDAARVILMPAASAGKVGFRLFQIGSSYVARTLARFTGAEALRDLGDFLGTFQGMYDGFKRRAAAVRELLGRADVGFVVVASPSPVSVDEALYFHEQLRAKSMPIAGVVANRVTPDLWPADGPLPSAGALAAVLPGASTDLAGRLARTLADHQIFARADRSHVERLFAAGEGAKLALPRLEADVHDLAGLAALGDRL